MRHVSFTHFSVLIATASTAAALYCAFTPAAQAQAATLAPAAAASAPLVPYFAPDMALLDAFGGKAGVFKLTDVFVDKMRADARIGHYFVGLAKFI